MNTLFREQRLGRIIADLSALIYSNLQPVALDAAPGFYASPSEADEAVFTPFGDQETWGGEKFLYLVSGGLRQRLSADRTSVPCCSWTPSDAEGVETARMQSYVTGTESRWDLMNPQFMLFLNGSLVQGLDVHHRCASLPTGAAQVDLQGYAGMTDRRFSCMCTPPSATRMFRLCIMTFARRWKRRRRWRPVTRTVRRFWPRSMTRPICWTCAIPTAPPSGKGLRRPGRSLPHAYTVAPTARLRSWPWAIPTLTSPGCGTTARQGRKCAAPFPGCLRLFERYDAFTFFQSTPQLFRWLEKDDPSLLEALSQRIAQGRMEVDGGLWLEADCNIPSGESLMRQVLYGKRYFKERFGTDCEVLWLPDVFGYNAAPAANSEAGRYQHLCHHQDQLEHAQPHALRYLPLAGNRRQQRSGLFYHHHRAQAGRWRIWDHL